MSESNPVVLFASYHAYLDYSSGAALATRDLFEDLTAHGWSCRVVCGPALDYQDGRGPADVLREYQVPYHLERCAPPRRSRYELYHYTLRGVPVSQYRPAEFDTRRPPTQDEGIPFLDVVSRACELYQPDVLLTYGGLPIGPHLIRRAKQRGVKVVFCLHNFDYRDPALLKEADALWVPSEFARQAYRERVGVEAEAVPWPWDRRRAIADRVEGRYVTFVNPIPVKGVAWFARIASEMFRRRPEIPILVVEGRGGVDWLRRVPLNLSGLTNLRGMHSTPWPKDFYSQSRVVLMPSLWEETFGRVAAESLANGIPVLASRRGALPETLGGAGMLFDIPESYTDPARMMDVPMPEEVVGWVETIERLWDDPGFYEDQRAVAHERAKAWEPDRLRPLVKDFFRRVAIGRWHMLGPGLFRGRADHHVEPTECATPVRVALVDTNSCQTASGRLNNPVGRHGRRTAGVAGSPRRATKKTNSAPTMPCLTRPTAASSSTTERGRTWGIVHQSRRCRWCKPSCSAATSTAASGRRK